MKIKTWLLLTYLLVMLLPLVGGYGLYLSITAYYQDKNVAEYFEKVERFMMDLKEYVSPIHYSTKMKVTMKRFYNAFTSNQVT